MEACNDSHDGCPLLLMIDLFQKINRVIRTENDLNLSGEEINFKEFVQLQLLDHEEEDDYLPVPVFSYLKPTIAVSLYHI